MTMKAPVDHEPNLPPVKKFDPAKRFRFTWPGQPAREVNGDELTTICAGADPSMLDISEVGGASLETPPPPMASRSSRSRDDDR